MTLEELNQADEHIACTAFESCCVSERWISNMVAGRPFDSQEALFSAAEAHWQTMQRSDILQAFEGHPRIGDVSTLRKKFANTAALAGHEQSGMNAADDALLHRMKTLNDEYYEKFGYLFIVCATGKSATEMLSILESRLPNDAQTELTIAAREQGKIIQIRLQKLLNA